MTVCTIDVHARDVVAKMIAAKARAPRGWGTGVGAGVRGLQPPLVPLPGGGGLYSWQRPSPHPPR